MSDIVTTAESVAAIGRRFPGRGAHDHVLPAHRQLYYGGAWHEPRGGYVETHNPATGESLGPTANANAADVDAAVSTAQAAFQHWRHEKPLARGRILRRIADIVRDHAHELALLDSLDCGNPFRELIPDAEHGANLLDLFAGLATEAKGSTLPMGPGMVNMTLREPYGVVARIIAYNHPMMFALCKAAPALAAGNSVIIKPPQQAPLSAYRLMELLEGVVPAGVFNVISGDAACGAALTTHPLVPVVTLVGSVPTGQAIAAAAAPRLKRVMLELGGKNALIVYPDADVPRAIAGAVRGMNFGWAGQSCGSTSRLFLHEDVHDRILAGVIEGVRAYRPGIPSDKATTMGCLVSAAQRDKVLKYIEFGKQDGATLVAGGGAPDDAALAHGFFIEPTVFAGVTPSMRIAREEIFGPVLSVLKWRDEEELFAAVNSVDYGLTASIFTQNLSTAHRAAARIEAGYIWVNSTSAHFTGAPFGGYKMSGIGREESIDELLALTQLKNVNITL